MISDSSFLWFCNPLILIMTDFISEIINMNDLKYLFWTPYFSLTYWYNSDSCSSRIKGQASILSLFTPAYLFHSCAQVHIPVSTKSFFWLEWAPTPTAKTTVLCTTITFCRNQPLILPYQTLHRNYLSILEIGHKCIVMINYWNKLLREAVNSSSVDLF